jgi:hypothetical protein
MSHAHVRQVGVVNRRFRQWSCTCQSDRHESCICESGRSCHRGESGRSRVGAMQRRVRQSCIGGASGKSHIWMRLTGAKHR